MSITNDPIAVFLYAVKSPESKRQYPRRFKQSNFLDCRISPYPSHTEYKGINRQDPDLIFIDLDRSTFKTERTHKLALLQL